MMTLLIDNDYMFNYTVNNRPLPLTTSFPDVEPCGLNCHCFPAPNLVSTVNAQGLTTINKYLSHESMFS